MTEVQFPIQIGLVGAPGSGKSKVAEAFYEKAYLYFQENGSELLLIPNSGNEIEEIFGQAMGPFGSYPDDLWAYHRRYEAEQQLRKDNTSFVSIGTVLDNMAHCGVNMEQIISGIHTPETQARYERQQVAMTQLTHLFMDRFQYKFGFYIPFKEQIVIAGEDDSANRYAERCDYALQAIFANFGMRIQVLDQPTFDEKAEEMLNTIKRIVEEGPNPGSSAALASGVSEEISELPPESADTLAE